MALAVASTSNAQSDNTSTVVVTKPTGVATGDLLIIGAVTLGSTITCPGFSTSASYYFDATGTVSDCCVSLIYRIADASDVSAVNYTVTNPDGANGVIVAMMRVTGWTTGNPAYDNATFASQSPSNPFTVSTTGLNILRPSASNLLIMIHGTGNNNGTKPTTTWSGHTVTDVSSGSETGFTEVLESTILGSANVNRYAFCFAYKTSTSTVTIASFTATGTFASAPGIYASAASILIVINEPISASASGTIVDIAPVTFQAATGANSSASIGTQIALSPLLTANQARVENPIWTNEGNATTTWTNQT